MTGAKPRQITQRALDNKADWGPRHPPTLTVPLKRESPAGAGLSAVGGGAVTAIVGG